MWTTVMFTLHQNITQTFSKKFLNKQDPAIQYTREYEKFFGH